MEIKDQDTQVNTDSNTQSAEPQTQRTETTEKVTQHSEPANQRPEPVEQHREPVTRNTQTVSTHVEGQNARRIIAAIFGAIEVILGFRFIFKLFGANPDSGFVKFLYSITGFFVNLFEEIFAEVTIGGSDSNAVFEPASILAMIIVALIALLVFKLMTPKDTNTNKTSYTSNSGPGKN